MRRVPSLLSTKMPIVTIHILFNLCKACEVRKGKHQSNNHTSLKYLVSTNVAYQTRTCISTVYTEGKMKMDKMVCKTEIVNL